VILTYDLDFGMLLARTHYSKPSVILLRLSSVRKEVAVTLINEAIGAYEALLDKGEILLIKINNSRMRLLPF